MLDFDEPYEAENAENIGFEGCPNPQQENELEETEKSRVINSNDIEEKNIPNDGKIKIDIDSVEQLSTSLAFSAQQIELAAKRFENNRDFQKVLNSLENLKVGEIENFDEKINDAVQKINILNLSKKISKHIDSKLNNIEISASKLEKYVEILNEDEVQNIMEEVEKLEKFRKNFKWKSIVLMSLTSLFAGAIISYVGLEQVYEYKIQEIKKEVFNSKDQLLNVFKNKEISILETKDTAQIIFENTKPKCFLGSNGEQVLQFSTKKRL